MPCRGFRVSIRFPGKLFHSLGTGNCTKRSGDEGRHLDRTESFCDRVLLETLGFRKNKFTLGGEPHIQYFNRHFGYVLHPSRATAGHIKSTALLSSAHCEEVPSLILCP